MSSNMSAPPRKNKGPGEKKEIEMPQLSANSIQVLTAHGGRYLTKTHRMVDGKITTRSYEKALLFSSEEVEVDGIDDLNALLRDLSEQRSSCVIRGARLSPGLGVVRRIMHAHDGAPPNFADTLRSWIMFDIDGVPPPEGLDPQQDRKKVIRHVINTYLPEPFHHASCSWQWSAGAGVHGWEKGLRCHLWFWLSEPATSQQLKWWAEVVQLHPQVDRGLFNAVQLHYTAVPNFYGMKDPCSPRGGLLRGSPVSVTLDLPTEAPAKPTTTLSGDRRIRTRKSNKRPTPTEPIYPSEEQAAAAATALTDGWVNEGDGHHEALMALSGALCLWGWEEEGVVAFIETAALERVEERPEEIADVVSATLQALADQRPVTGWPRLTELLGGEVVDKARILLGGQVKWEERLRLTETGGIKPTSSNAQIIIDLSPELSGLSFDEMAGVSWWNELPPWDRSTLPVPRARNDTDGGEFCRWVEENIRLWDGVVNNGESITQPADAGFAPKVADLALSIIANRRPFNLVRDYLDQLEWDGDPRIDAWLTTYLGVEPSEYTSAVGAAWLISAVARVFEPGCKVDHMLVLEGPQGIFKSRGIEVLAGSENYAEITIDVASKDSLLALHGRWILEWAEMAGRRETEKVKSFLTRGSDWMRVPYGQATQNFPRRSVIIATTNDATYLTDSTGNRRYWPVKVGTIDLDLLTADRDQLWAEAVARYKADEQWWLTPEQEALAHQQQEDRLAIDEWEESIRQALYDGPMKRKAFVTSSELLGKAIGIVIADQHSGTSRRLAKIMQRLGWKKGSSSQKIRGYRRPSKPSKSSK